MIRRFLLLDTKEPPPPALRGRASSGTPSVWSRREMLRLRRNKPVADGCWRVEINADLCSDCQACVRICPPKALARAEQNDCFIYSLNARLCNGCGDCSQVCAEQALQVTHSDQQADMCEAVRLTAAICKQCSNKGVGLAEGLCFACRQSDARLDGNWRKLRS